ncbi:MAG: mechanosensitive ion channel domain-containing protein [Solidesulfovibrio sp. DCME]|uniref:mechanosensitive ion channel domain-containing protein n=1 Tax=Solidesulfovibrio sp. DCME TaxID=3447380 RepID=UPI003D1184ED
MRGDAARLGTIVLLLVLGMFIADAGPCFSRTNEPAPVIVLAAAPTKYVIKSGDTINVLAQRFKVPAAAILRANPGLNPGSLQIGKAIVIPAPGQAAPAAPEEPAAPAAASPAKPQGIELRPEKAPQATPAPGGGLKEHDLAEPAAKSPSAAPAPASLPVPARTAAAAVAPATAGAPKPDSPAADALPGKVAAPLTEHAAAPVAVEKVGDRTRFSVGGQAFFADQIVPWALSLGSRLFSGLVLFVVGIWVVGRLTAVLARIMRGRDIAPEIVSFVASLARWGLALVVLIAALGQLGFNISSLLALFGAAGLAVSLALKDTLSNFASGVMLLLFRYFRVGDTVSVPGTAGAAGQVVAIDIFNTVIESEAGDTVIVPNAKIVGNVIVVSPAKAPPPKARGR